MNAESNWEQLANAYHQCPQAKVHNLHKEEQLGSTVGLSGRARAWHVWGSEFDPQYQN